MTPVELEALRTALQSALKAVEDALYIHAKQEPLDRKFAELLATRDEWPAGLAHNEAWCMGIHARQVVATLIRLGYHRYRRGPGAFWSKISA